MSTASYDPFGTPPSCSTLATTPLPRRVHRVLEQLFALVSGEFARDLDRLLGEFEQELFRLAEQARDQALRSSHMETLNSLRLHRADLVPHFLVGLETALTTIREPAAASSVPAAPRSPSRDLRLVDDNEVDEDAALRMIAVRHEARASLPLLLLGQRFGVLGGAPAFDAERLPVGPHLLSRTLAKAARSLQINLDARLLLYRLFDRQLTQTYVPLVDAMNELLAHENVLPGLTYVPLRVRPQALARKEDASLAHGRREAGDRAETRTTSGPPARAYTSWFGEAGNMPDDQRNSDGEMFALLQQLLTERHGLLDKLRARSQDQPHATLATQDVIAALGALQAQAPGSHTARSVPDIRQSVLALGRQHLGGQAAGLSREDSDTFELLGLLYAEIGRELRQDTPNTELLGRLQLPLLQLALRDHGFFARSQHPARQLLNAVAESGAPWLAEDDADPHLQAQLHSVVEDVVERYDGDATVFEAANDSLQQHLRGMARKAAVSERRHIEAARGKEKLELAKRGAQQALEAIMLDQHLPRFLLTLLSQTWADVLTLVLLRHGEDSAQWRQHEADTRHVVDIAVHGAAAPAGLAGRIEDALTLVGYHADEAAAIACRLTSGHDGNSDDATDDPASRTELAMKLKSRARLGPPSDSKPCPPPPRNAHEESCYQQVCTLPFGSWIEFVAGPDGGIVRRRLAWYSQVTGVALFVNQRGHRVEEQTLDHIARLVASGQASVVTSERGRLVDRAWLAAVDALRNLAHRAATPEGQP